MTNRRLYGFGNDHPELKDAVIYGMPGHIGNNYGIVIQNLSHIVPFGCESTYGEATLAACYGEEPVKLTAIEQDIRSKWEQKGNDRWAFLQNLFSAIPEIRMDGEDTWIGKGSYDLEIGKDVEGRFWIIITGGIEGLKNQVANYFEERTEDGCLRGLIADEYLRILNILDSIAGEYRESLLEATEGIMRRHHKEEKLVTRHNTIRQQADGTFTIRRGAAEAKTMERQILAVRREEDSYLIGRGQNRKEWGMSVPLEVGNVAVGSLLETFAVENWIRVQKTIYL